MVTIMHEQNIIFSKSHLDSTTYEQTIICGQLFAGHVVGYKAEPHTQKTSLDRSVNLNYATTKNKGPRNRTQPNIFCLNAIGSLF